MASNEHSGPGAGWDEAQCTTALAQLEGLQAQLDNLRMAIPRVVEPFNSYSSDSSSIYKTFQKAILETQNDMKAFRSSWEDEETKRVFAHTKESFGKDKDLSPMAKMPKYGWVEKEAEMGKSKERRKSGGEKVEIHDVNLSQAEILQLMEAWRKKYPTIRVATKDHHKDILIQFLAGDVKLKFRVVIETAANGRHNLKAECLGTTMLGQAVTRCVASRPRANDFKHLLDMIAAYKTVKGSCKKCGKLLDADAIIPPARRSKTEENGEGVQEIVWEAFHEACLD